MTEVSVKKMTIKEWMRAEGIVDPFSNRSMAPPEMVVKLEAAKETAKALGFKDLKPLDVRLKAAKSARIMYEMYPSDKVMVASEEEAQANLTIIQGLMRHHNWPQEQFRLLKKWRWYWRDCVRRYGMTFGGDDTKKKVNTKHKQRKAERAERDRELRRKMRGK